ncbi:unnamed protein product [Soboliphyme baturini]|uniref:PND domain-containing protein n=1 Tax=Soboliphyme baturini TaxID=241478 RepID=A0A183J111_9BILA|nr:unnamed protein product [Soboliphyme baturini]
MNIFLDRCGNQRVKFVDYVQESDFEILPRVTGIFVDSCARDSTLARQKTLKFGSFVRSGPSVVGVVVLVRSKGDHDHFMQFQKLCCIDMNLKLITAANIDEAAGFILKMVISDHSVHNDIQAPPCTDEDVHKILRRIPGMGPVKARTLLQNFGSMVFVTKLFFKQLRDIPRYTEYHRSFRRGMSGDTSSIYYFYGNTGGNKSKLPKQDMSKKSLMNNWGMSLLLPFSFPGIN